MTHDSFPKRHNKTVSYSCALSFDMQSNEDYKRIQESSCSAEQPKRICTLQSACLGYQPTDRIFTRTQVAFVYVASG